MDPSNPVRVLRWFHYRRLCSMRCSWLCLLWCWYHRKNLFAPIQKWMQEDLRRCRPGSLPGFARIPGSRRPGFPIEMRSDNPLCTHSRLLPESHCIVSPSDKTCAYQLKASRMQGGLKQRHFSEPRAGNPAMPRPAK